MAMQTTVEIEVGDPGRIEAYLDDAIELMAEYAAEVAEDIVQTAQGYAPVDTGTLRDDIDQVVTRLADARIQLEVGTDIEYGPFQEFGTIVMMESPYLRPAFLDHKDDVLDAMERALIDAAEAHDLR